MHQDRRVTYSARQGGGARSDVETGDGVMSVVELEGKVVSKVKQVGTAMYEAVSGGQMTTNVKQGVNLMQEAEPECQAMSKAKKGGGSTSEGTKGDGAR